MGYSHHRVALFGKKASQERLASSPSDMTLNDDDGLPISSVRKREVQAES